jgi:hypothetical protein
MKEEGMAKQQGRGKPKSGGGEAGKRRGKEAGIKLKDLDAKKALNVRGGDKHKDERF